MARLVGPGVSGLLIALIGTGWVIALNSFSFMAMFIALATMNADQLHPAPVQTGRGRTREGFRYALQRGDLMILLACGFAVGGTGFNYQISNAVMATEFFNKGPASTASSARRWALVPLLAALWAAGRATPRLRFILLGMAGYTAFNLAAAFAPNFVTFAALQVPVGLATITVLVTANTMIQSSTSPHMRGRVMALWGLVIMGVTPVISPVVGWLGDNVGPQATILFGVVCVGIALVLITAVIMRTDRLRLRFDLATRGWLRLERATLTEEVEFNQKG